MLNTRQKCLIYFLSKVEICSKLRLAKIFFLMNKEGQIGRGFKFYGFIPYRFGPYSFELFKDIEELEGKKLLNTNDNSVSYMKGDYSLTPNITRILNHYLEVTNGMDDRNLIDHIYTKYPEYTIFSEIEKKMEYSRDRTGIITIGYEGLSIDEFLMKLIQEKVQVLADVRKNPWSMKFGYKKFSLNSFCNNIGIDYINYPSLGISGIHRKNLKSKRDYDALFNRFRVELIKKENELKNLKHIGEERRIALMCFEQDPAYCHRRILAEELAKMGSEVTIT
jgi:uncharacterized protein (DUF488 family)